MITLQKASAEDEFDLILLDIYATNFENLAKEINSIEDILSPAKKTITGLESMSIKKGTLTSLDETLIETNGSISTGGGVSIGKNLQVTGTSVLKKTVLIEDGDLTLSSTSSKLTVGGDLKIAGGFQLAGMEKTAVAAAYESAFVNNQTSSLIRNTSNVVIGGKLEIQGRNVFVLDWSGYTADSQTTTKQYLDTIRLSTENALPGQVLTVISYLGNVTSKDFYLDKTTLLCDTASPTKGVVFSANYQVCELMFNGTAWIVTQLRGATIE